MTARPSRAGRPRASGIVTLLTDFGLDDPYVGALKGAILSVNPAATLVDITHGVPPQDVLRGALALVRAYPCFPAGTVHVAVVDPGVGTTRRPLAVMAGSHCFVGPDNGLLGWIGRQPGSQAVALTNARYHRVPVSRTFQGRDVFGPVAGHCSRGVPLSRLGVPAGPPIALPWPDPQTRGGRVLGQVLTVDRFGNLLTNLPGALLGGRPRVALDGRRSVPLVGTYADVRRGEAGAVVDSSGLVEIFVREGSARRALRAGVGAPVSLSAPRPRRRGGSVSRSSTGPEWPGPPRPGLPSPSSRTRRPSSGPRTDSPSRTSRRP